MARRNKPVYTGKLAKPLPPIQKSRMKVGLLSGWEFDDPDSVKERRHELLTRVRLLFAHYGIAERDPNGWMQLSLRLAIAHVPGFQERARGGRPKSLEKPEALTARRELLALAKKKRRSGESDEALCRRLSRTPRILPTLYGARQKLSPHTLESHLTLAKKEARDNYTRLAEALAPWPFGSLGGPPQALGLMGRLHGLPDKGDPVLPPKKKPPPR